MNTTIENEFLKVEISSYGGEMQSIRGKDGTEYLWQGDVNTWVDKAINLFPYIGRLTNGSYIYQGKEYQMNIHGLVPYAELTVDKAERNSVCFVLDADEKTKEIYPFEFSYSIEYTLEDSAIRIRYRVENLDEKEMYFGIGGHPGFQVPIGEVGEFEDYYLEFAEEAEARRVGFSDSCFVTRDDEEFPLKQGVRLPLRHSLFDRDAIVLKDMSRCVTLKSDKTEKTVTVEYPQMEYLGIWHWPKTAVNYVCIEPWSSLPSRDQVVEDIAVQPGLISLKSGCVYENEWKIRIGQ